MAFGSALAGLVTARNCHDRLRTWRLGWKDWGRRKRPPPPSHNLDPILVGDLTDVGRRPGSWLDVEIGISLHAHHN